MKDLFTYLNSIKLLSLPLQDHLAGIVKTRRLRKKEHLLEKDQFCRDIYFIRSGLVYSYYHSEDTVVVSWIMKENELVYTVPVFCEQRPSYEYICALENTELYYISYMQLHDMLQQFPEFHFIYLKISNHYHKLSDQRSRVLMISNKLDRLIYMRENYSEMLNRLPNKLLASYLGITAEHLSKVKKELYK